MTTKEQIQKLAKEIVRLVNTIVRLKGKRSESEAAYLELSGQLQASIVSNGELSVKLQEAVDGRVSLALQLDTANVSLAEALSNDRADAAAIAAAVKATEEQQAITASLLVNAQEVTDALAAESAKSEELAKSLALATESAAQVKADAEALEASEAAELEALIAQAQAVVD